MSMRLIIATESDPASMNIHRELLSLADWREGPDFHGKPSHLLGESRLVIVPEEHLYNDNVDSHAATLLGETPRVVVYLSRHRSESGHRSLTVHPIGNHHDADFGGRPNTLVPSAPAEMTGTLRALCDAARELDYRVSFEATHHGPFLSTPTFFIEAGSDMAAWSDIAAGRALAEAVLKAQPGRGPIGIGVGGGHYMPRITDVALSRDVCFGHMIASYALEEWDESVLDRVIAATPGAEFVYFHRKALSKPLLRKLEDWFSGRGIRVVREDDLPAL